MGRGPYSQAIKAGGFVFTAGQIPIDPATGKMVEGDVKAQTERVLKNLSAVLTAAGSSMDRIVKTTVFLKNISDFPAMNEVYGQFCRCSKIMSPLNCNETLEWTPILRQPVKP